MAAQNLSPALPTSARSAPYPKASPGYGKRAVPGQRPPAADDFAFLPERERYIAGYVDRLPDGAAMSIKSLAKCQPLYGQMAVGSALRALAVAGHLRQVRCAVDGGEGIRWVTRTFWSRTARDNEWWTAFLAAEESRCAPQPAVAPVGPPPWVPAEPAATDAAEAPPSAPVLPKQRTEEPQGPSPAYLVLAGLGRTDARLALSAADCAVLEQLAAQWFARGVDADYLTRALTAGLPEAVDSPVGFVRRRLVDKLPPQLPAPATAAQAAPARHLMIECADCGAVGRPEVFRDGLCGPCLRSAHPAPTEGSGAACDVGAHARRLREQLRAR